MKNAELQKCMVGMMLALAMSAHAQDFPPEQIKLGGDTYSRHCAPCHGVRMKNPEGAFDHEVSQGSGEPLSQLGHQREEQHAAVGKPAQTRRDRCAVGVRCGRRKTVIPRDSVATLRAATLSRGTTERRPDCFVINT